ncbi:ATP-dependent RNA helicase DbpA [Saccharospirillum salsuginis]|uniref:ATP-dependent RNA helicase n=1 Tax=Saccharospirillum salsuginis TaxID=418750 RepID=A0A918N5F2_9GAMM|nr:ATP-dependent RNA helicase DbpA [Saccharospirillum salsuginis]GGX38829.1 ATP-dependent RNA helicase [Saccharospirillum salsuginis]
MPSSFNSLPLSADMLGNLETLNYTEMTPIQAEALPLILEGRDLIAKAKTGSGKTAAFGVGLLHHLRVDNYRVQALVLCPTRELADQVAKELRRLARATHNVKILTLCGGMPLGPQVGSLEHGAHIVVGTPGRIQEHLRKGTLKLEDVSTLVLDEADRMLDMGFTDAIQAIIGECPSERQTLLFSATYPDQIAQLAAHYLREPAEVSVESLHPKNQIQQFFYEVEDRADKYPLVERLLAHHQAESTVIFCHTKKDCQDLADRLSDDGYSALALHGDLEQRDRDQVLIRFANKSCANLVATDVAARGLDIKALDLVINFEPPQDPEVYIHRIGRTGRAGQEGVAVSLVTPAEGHRVNRIQALLGETAHWGEAGQLPDPGTGVMQPPMVTLCIDGGKKNKIRPGDLLGALTGEAGFRAEQIGKIDIFPLRSYVAVSREIGKAALQRLMDGKVKGRKVKVRLLK